MGEWRTKKLEALQLQAELAEQQLRVVMEKQREEEEREQQRREHDRRKVSSAVCLCVFVQIVENTCPLQCERKAIFVPPSVDCGVQTRAAAVAEGAGRRTEAAAPRTAGATGSTGANRP